MIAALAREFIGWLLGTTAGRMLLWLCAVAYVAWCLYEWAWHRGHDVAHAAGQREVAALRADIEAQRAQAERDARAAEERQRAALRAAEREYMVELEHAATVANEALAELRAGNLRLRKHWQGCIATAELSAAAAAAARADARADDRAESAGRIVRAAAECDAQVRGLQAVIRARS